MGFSEVGDPYPANGTTVHITSVVQSEVPKHKKGNAFGQSLITEAHPALWLTYAAG